MWKYVLAWIPMVFIAIANGAMREGWYGKHLSELQAHQVSTATGVLLFGVYIWVLMRIWRPESAEQAMTIGLVWLGMTVAFEFLLGIMWRSGLGVSYYATTIFSLDVFGWWSSCGSRWNPTSSTACTIETYLLQELENSWDEFGTVKF